MVSAARAWFGISPEFSLHVMTHVHIPGPIFLQSGTTLSETKSGLTAGNKDTRMGKKPAWYTLGLAPKSTIRHGANLDFDGVDRDAHAVFGTRACASQLATCLLIAYSLSDPVS